MPRFHLDYETAALIRRVFLPANPRKLRTAHPEVRRAIDDYLDALYAAKPNESEKESNPTDHQAPASGALVHPVVGQTEARETK